MRFFIMMYFSLLVVPSLAFVSVGCGGPDRQAAQAAETTVSNYGVARMDANLTDYQCRLLDLALDTATAIPVNPHIKDRSKAQEKVFQAYLKLDQPDRAQVAMIKIENWRRGVCYAGLGFYYARKNRLDEAGKYLDEAGKIADTAEDWRRDRIKMEIARALTLMGKTRQANDIEAQVENVEKGKTAQAESMLIPASDFDEQMKKMDSLIATGDFDILNNSLGAYAELFNRFYDDASLRSEAENKIRQSWGALPIFIRMQLLMKLAQSALDHSDQAKALALVNDVQQQLDDNLWQPEDKIAMAAEIAGLRYRAGDHEKALADAGSIEDFFDQRKDRIVNIWRSGALRPLAEAYQAMGETQKSLKLYKVVVEEGAMNPNSRPCAEDLSETCISLAIHSVEPDDDLWSRILAIREGLGSPW